MRYLRRALEASLVQAAKHFPSVVLTGPRRAGKTWLLRHAFPKADYFLLEDPSVVARLRSDPQGFLDEVRTPVILDEVQNVPEIFSLVRARIDRQPRRTGRWLLTGSQEAPLMQKVTESMAGRAAVLQLRPLSTWESEKVSLFLGGYPEVVARPRAAHQWFSSYVQTYLERDVRAVTMVKDLATFRRFLALVASRHGQILNRTDLAAPLGVSVPTITQWLGVLETTAQILLVPPFYENVGKRLVKSPKVYLADSGLACHLLGIDSPRELARSPFLGVLFEGFMAAEIIKAQVNAGRRPEIYYFRDEQGLEVDFLVPGRQRAVSLVECKATRTAVPSMAAPMQRLAQALKKKRPRGGAVEMSLVYQPSRTAIATTALAPGVQAVAWQAFVRALTRGFARILLLFLLIGLEWSPARGESPAPSVHWGSTAFPDQYSTVTTGLTLNRFTPVDGLGNKYDSTVGNTLGFNLITLSWTQHWGGNFEGWSTNLTTGVSPTSDEPSQFFQNEVIHQLRQLPAVPTVAPRKETDVMIDGSVTRWFPLFQPKVMFVGGGFSVGTIYQQGFLRAGIRRLQISPTFYSGSWGEVSVRASTLGRISYQDNGAVLHAVRQTAGLVQPAIAFGQYRRNSKGETIPTWEIEFAVMWDSGIFVNTSGQSQKMFAWSLALSGGPLRFETWNDSMGKLAERDYGPTYGASLTLDLLRSWNQIACMTGNPQWMPL